MKFNFSKNLGFTLVELLVVIAIIGILSSVAVVNLNSARDKARTSVILQTLDSLLPVALLCMSDGNNLHFDGPTECSEFGGSSPVPPEPICENSSILWPAMVTGEYADWGWDWTDCTSNVDTGAFSYEAENADLGIIITCSQNGCVVIP